MTPEERARDVFMRCQSEFYGSGREVYPRCEEQIAIIAAAIREAIKEERLKFDDCDEVVDKRS